MSREHSNNMLTGHDGGSETDGVNPEIVESYYRWRTQYDRYMHRTYDELGVASTEQTTELRTWLEQLKISEESVNMMKETWSHYKKQMESGEKLYREEFMQKLDAAFQSSPKVLSRKSYEKWQKRFKNPNVHYKQREEFVREKFPKYIERLKKASEKREELKKDPRIKQLSTASVPHLALFLSDEKFLELHCIKERDKLPSREALIAMVQAALEAQKKGQHQPYQQAKGMLEEAAAQKIISWNSVGILLKKIFSKQDPDGIADFVNGKAAFSLRNYLEKCNTIHGRFFKVEEKRQKKGTPRHFHFVSMEVFINWPYEKRKSYVTEAEYSLETLPGEPPVFGKIRHALASGDSWEAEDLIKQAKQEGGMSDDQTKRLRSMENYLTMHLPQKARPSAKEHPSDEEIAEKINGALGQVGYESIKDRFKRAMKLDYGTLWALCTMNYNWKWCRLHGYSDDEKDRELRERAKDDTYDHLKHGQPEDHVNNDMTTDTSTRQAARWSEKTNSAQAIHVDETTNNSVLVEDYIYHNQQNRSVWYWTRIMEKNIPYGHMKYVIENIQPILKWAMRELQGRNAYFDGGKVVRRAGKDAKTTTVPELTMTH